MPNISVSVTNEAKKAVEAIVPDLKEWLENALAGKVAKCMKRVIDEESNLNSRKLSGQQMSDWVKDNTFKSRKEKDGQ